MYFFHLIILCNYNPVHDIKTRFKTRCLNKNKGQKEIHELTFAISCYCQVIIFKTRKIKQL